MPRPPSYRVGDCVVDGSRNCVRRPDGQELPLRHKTFRTLLYLLEHRDRLVSKDELFREIWDEVAVTDGTLVQCIREIRQALGDDSQQPQFVKTVPKVGYRFVGPVVPIEPEASMGRIDAPMAPDAIATDAPVDPVALRPRAPWLRRHAVAAALVAGVLCVVTVFGLRRADPSDPERPPESSSVVIVPFTNASSDHELEWLRKGLPDMLMTGLARSHGVTVVSRTQLQQLIDRQTDGTDAQKALVAAQTSGARTVIVGTFGRLNDTIRIDVQLLDAATANVRSAQSLTVTERQLLADVDLLALRVAIDLGVAAGAAPQPRVAEVMTSSLEAYRFYSLAIDKAHAYDTDSALRLLEQATALDPAFAMAFGRIGYIYAIVRVNEGERAKPYLEKAFSLSDRLSEKDKLFINAWYAHAQNDVEGAVARLREIVTRYPRETEAYWRLGSALNILLRVDEAIAAYERGLAIDPEAAAIWNALGFCYDAVARYDRAVAAHERYVALEPLEANAYDSLGITYAQAGRFDDALVAFNRALALRPSFHFAVLHQGDVLFQLGRYRDALSHYEQYLALAPSDWDRAIGYNHIAIIHWHRGDLANAEKAARQELALGNDFGTALRIALARGDRRTAQALEARHFGTPTAPGTGVPLTRRHREFLRGEIAMARAQGDEAIDRFKAMLQIPHVTWGIESVEDALARAYVTAGRVDDGIQEYRRIVALNPTDALSRYQLAALLERRGDTASARAEYQRFLDLWKHADADLAEVRHARARLLL